MRLSQEKNKEILESVRREMVVNPSVTIFELQDVLNQHYHHAFDKNFIGKLKNKIHRERAYRVNKRTVNYELALLEDTINETSKILWEIVNNPETSSREKISAIRELRSAKSAFLEAMLNAGVFEPQIGKIKQEEELSPETQEGIRRALSYAFGEQNKVENVQN